MKVGLLVYTRLETHYCTFEVGKVPALPEGTQRVFSLLKDVNTAPELLKEAREEANRLGIGKVVNLPDLPD